MLIRLPLTSFQPKMSLREAQSILNVKSNEKNRSVIEKRHKELIALNHPDTGGSVLLSEKINEAKDLILSKHFK